jgi:hypothetical protein
MFIKEMQRAFSLGARYGLRAIPMYADPSVDTPEIDESAIEGAIGIVITLASVIIALYITAIVVASFSKSASSGGWYSNGTAIGGGGLGLSSAWNQTLYGLDSGSNNSFSLAGILPIAIVGVGILVIIISAFAMR